MFLTELTKGYRFGVLFSFSLLLACQKEEINSFDVQNQPHSPFMEDDLESAEELFPFAACRKANESQVLKVNEGNAKRNQFLKYCQDNTNNSTWCNQLVRPNPASKSIFTCTYGDEQEHQLIHPSESTWSNAVTAVRLIKELELMNIKVCLIYNWWRPEPYNKNVGGAAGRHPYGTSVDVQFCSKQDKAMAHAELCKMRKQGRLRALGHYEGNSLHFGIGDRVANTWGKSCPN